MGTLVRRSKEETEVLDPSTVKVAVSKQGRALYFSRSPIPHNRDSIVDVEYYLHVGVYIYEREFLLEFAQLDNSFLERVEKLEQLRALENSYSIRVFETKETPIGVDTPEDLERVRQLLTQ